MEININKRKWIILNVHRRPESNVDNFMEETCKILDKTFSKYDRIILMDDINIESNETEQTKTASKLSKQLCITYDLHNLVTESTCFTHTHESAIDVILANCKYNFMHSKASETGLSDFHKMVCTFMRNTYSRQESVKIIYGDYKGFDQTKLSIDYKKSRSQNPIDYISDANN